jgi:hypothetical protein
MYSRVKLPIGASLLLVLCVFSLATHFIAEGLTSFDGIQNFAPGARGETSHAVHDHGEDLFVSPVMQQSTDHPFVSAILSETIDTLSFSAPPQSPPPNS